MIYLEPALTMAQSINHITSVTTTPMVAAIITTTTTTTTRKGCMA